MHATLYQNCQASDYLLAEEGGICGKLNHSHCCIQTDDNGQLVRNIATNIRKITHVPVQTWDGCKPNNYLGNWFSWLFPLLGPIAIIRDVLCFGPCLLSLLLHFISSCLDSIKLQMLLCTHLYYCRPLNTCLGLAVAKDWILTSHLFNGS
jgi:hypothetical protein